MANSFSEKPKKVGKPEGEIIQTRSFKKPKGHTRLSYLVDIPKEAIENPANSFVAKVLVNGEPRHSVWLSNNTSRSVEHDLSDVPDGAELIAEVYVISAEPVKVGISQVETYKY